MMGDPFPGGNSGRSNQASKYGRSPFTSNSTSPPTPSFRPDVFGPPSTNGSAQIYASSPTAERYSTDRNGTMPPLSASTSDPIALGFDSRSAPAVVIRRLPFNIGIENLRSMLLFSNDLLDTEFIHSPYPEDRGFATAVAHFQSSTGAHEAQQKLHGKPNTTKEATMIVETHNSNGMGAFERRNTIDGAAPRTQTSSASSGSSLGAPPGRSRFGSTFHISDKVSPPLPTSSSGTNGEFPNPENSTHFQTLFSPQSPLANGDHRVSGKSMINNDSVDDETDELLKDPAAYAKSGQQPAARRATNPAIPVTHFGRLSLSSPNGTSNNVVHSPNGYTSPRGHPVQASMGAVQQTSPPNSSSNSSYLPGYPRPQYPPVNPADQNPPCNTLYVGNLPIDTSEDELKSLFSKQRGYKRLCFRTKQNGPMCFVEFEDVSFATKTLHELYGHPLHNSVKGGIRLSFSKNPLGVRGGQPNGMGPNAVMSPQAMSPGYGSIMNGGGFSAVSGPPPGLSTPPGLANGGQYRSPPATGMDGMFANPFGVPSPDFASQLSPRANFSGGVPPTLGNGTYDGTYDSTYGAYGTHSSHGTHPNHGHQGTQHNQGNQSAHPNQGSQGTHPNQGNQGNYPNQGNQGNYPNQGNHPNRNGYPEYRQ